MIQLIVNLCYCYNFTILKNTVKKDIPKADF